MFFHHSHLVAEPCGDLENAHASAGEQAGEGVPHDVWRDPAAALGGHKVGVEALEVVAVEAAASLLLPRGQDVACARAVFFHPVAEFLREGDGALLGVFEGDAGVLAEVEQTGVEIEPLGAGLDDLGLPQTGVEPAVEDKAEVVAGAGGEEVVAELGGAEVGAGGGLRLRDAGGIPAGGEWLGGVARSEAGLEVAPIKESAQEHEIPVSGGGAGGSCSAVVPGAELLGCHTLGCDIAEVGGPAAEDGELGIGTGEAPLARRAAGGDIALDQVVQRLAIGQDPGLKDLAPAADGLLEVPGLKGYEGSLAMNLAAKPINLASLVESANLHRGRLSHFTVTLANRIWADMRGDGLWEWCAVEGSNLWPLPCQNSFLRSIVTLFLSHRHILEGANG